MFKHFTDVLFAALPYWLPSNVTAVELVPCRKAWVQDGKVQTYDWLAVFVSYN